MAERRHSTRSSCPREHIDYHHLLLQVLLLLLLSSVAFVASAIIKVAITVTSLVGVTASPLLSRRSRSQERTDG